ncbi:hypothetical protein [Streptosporangium sp. G12]
MKLTPPSVEDIVTMVSDALCIYGWGLSRHGNVVKISIGPFGDDDKSLLAQMNFRVVVVEGEETPVLLAGPAYVSGSGDGYMYLRCDKCGEIIACIDAGSSLAGLNAEAADHTCSPAALSVSSGEAESR